LEFSFGWTNSAHWVCKKIGFAAKDANQIQGLNGISKDGISGYSLKKRNME